VTHEDDVLPVTCSASCSSLKIVRGDLPRKGYVSVLAHVILGPVSSYRPHNLHLSGTSNWTIDDGCGTRFKNSIAILQTEHVSVATEDGGTGDGKA
jgi:hypothetical protein